MRIFAGIFAFMVIVLIGVAILINEWLKRRRAEKK
jgi:preprotein translocase subunit SecD